MQEQWFADRLTLVRLVQQHPDWRLQDFATATRRSVAWVKKWKRRLTTSDEPPEMACQSHSSARHTPPPGWSEPVITRILELRDQPPDGLHRVPGADAILWFLHQDATLADERRPRSATTIWKILDQHQRIHRRARPPHQPLDRPAPLEEIEIDFTDVGTIPCDPDDKRQHAAETFNWVDRGTSRPMAAHVRADFHAATTIETCAQIVQQIGLPKRIRCDRDPRFVGSIHTDDFPSPFMRFWMNLGVELVLCPPHRPDLKPFVERFNKAYTEECIQAHQPRTVAEAQAVTDAFLQFYCQERPHQGDACRNQPPDIAFPQLPALPSVPLVLDPDAWLRQIDGTTYVRKVNSSGRIGIGGQSYFVSRQYSGQEITLKVDAHAQEWTMFHREQLIKRVAMKDLTQAVVTFEEMVKDLCKAADATEGRQRERQRQRNARKHRPRGG